MASSSQRLAFGFIAAACLPLSSVFAADSLTDLGGDAEVVLVQEGFEFTEGPASDGQGNLYFTDIPAQAIHRLDASGKVTLAIQPSGHCNGLMFDASGKLLGCQMDGALAWFDLQHGTAKPLATEFEGKRFNAPNDLTIDQHGGVYFTDPLYRAPTPLPQGTMNVFYRDPQGAIHVVVRDLPAPNGIGLSLDERTLYVIPSQTAEMFAFPIAAPGQVGEKSVFCRLTQPADRPDANSGGDGMTLDQRGNLYITSAMGVQVFSSDGAAIGVIRCPQQPANVAFGGPEGKTLYMTARTGLYRCDMKVAGWRTQGTVPVADSGEPR